MRVAGWWADALSIPAGRGGGFGPGPCPECGEWKFSIQKSGYACSACEIKGTNLEQLANYLELDATSEAEELPVPVRALDADPPRPPEYRVQEFALEAELGIFVGQGGDWKTTSAVTVGGCVAGGYPLFDSRIFLARQGRVLIVSNEDGLGVLLNRLEALIRGHGWDRERVLGNVYFLAQEGVDLDSAAWRSHLSDQVDELGISVVIFDPYAELTTQPENDNDAVKSLVRYWRSLCSKGVTVLVVHHAGKKSEGKGKLDRIRGASALNAAARFVYFFEQAEVGFSVECLKLSRGERPTKFVVQADIEADTNNGASWTRARLSYMSEHAAEDMVAERFVLGALTAEPGPTSSELKKMGAAEGVDVREMSEALKHLRERGHIDYEAGEYNRRHWHLKSVASRTEGNRPKSAGKVVAPADHATDEVIAYATDATTPREAGSGCAPDRGQRNRPDRPAGESATCHDCGVPVEPDPSFDVLRCNRCAMKAGKGAA